MDTGKFERGVQNTTESIIKPKLNLRQIFLDKLNSIPPLDIRVGTNLARGYEEFGIEKVKRYAIALIVVQEGSVLPKKQGWDFDLWIEDPNDIPVDPFYPFKHYEVIRRMEEHAKSKNSGKIDVVIHGEILQDDKEKVYLTLDVDRADRMKDELSYEGQTGEVNFNSYLNLCKKYGIEKIIGTFPVEIEEEGRSHREYEERILFDSDIFERRKENTIFLKIAEKHQLTWLEFLRFRVLALSAQETHKEESAKALRDLKESKKLEAKPHTYVYILDRLAREIVSERGSDDKESFIL